MTLDLFLKEFDASLVALCIMALLVIGTVISWHIKKDGFDLSQTVVDNVTGKIAIEKVGYMSVLAIWIWGFVAMVLRDKLTEWYVGIGVGAFVLGRLGSSWLSVKKDLSTGEPKT